MKREQLAYFCKDNNSILEFENLFRTVEELEQWALAGTINGCNNTTGGPNMIAIPLRLLLSTMAVSPNYTSTNALTNYITLTSVHVNAPSDANILIYLVPSGGSPSANYLVVSTFLAAGTTVNWNDVGWVLEPSDTIRCQSDVADTVICVSGVRVQ